MKEVESFRIGFPGNGGIGIFFVRIHDALGWFAYVNETYYSNSVGIAEDADSAAVEEALAALADDAANVLTPMVQTELQPVEMQEQRNAAIGNYSTELRASIADRYIHP